MDDIAARNRRNRARGKSTSAELAKYLGGQNVEGMLWKHDVQGDGFRLQSKRDSIGRSPAMMARLIESIDYGKGWLRGLYLVTPGKRLTSGIVVVGLREWTEWHGWDLPEGRLLHAGAPLLVIALPVFRDVHVNEQVAA